MKAIALFSLALISLASYAQGGSPEVDLADPSSLVSKQSCIAGCEAVLESCKRQCGETEARADERHFDIPDVPVSACMQDCEESFRICSDAC